METMMDIEEYVDADGDTIIMRITGLETLFDERSEDPCENSSHLSHPEYHSGAGEWLLKVEGCPCMPDHELVCDKWMKQTQDGTMTVACKRCGFEEVPAEVVFSVVGRKGVDF